MWEVSQYLFLVETFKQTLGMSLLFIFIVVLLISLITLPISSHKKEHIFPQIVSCLMAILVTVYITVSIHKYYLLIINLMMIIAVSKIGYSIYKRHKINYWYVEMLIGGLMGFWNIVILL